MTTLRKTPALSNNGGVKINDDTYAEEVNANVVALWPRVNCWLVSIAGSGNAITAQTDTSASNGAITAYTRPMTFFYKAINANTGAVTINIDNVAVVNIKDQFGAALQGAEFSIGGVYALTYDGTQFIARGVTAGVSAAPSTAPGLIVNDQQTSGVSEGITSGAYRQRTLNTVVRNTIGASLASNQITLLAGTYYAEWSASGFSVDLFKTRLQNITDTATIALGSNERANSSVPASAGRSRGTAYFTISASKVIQIEMRTQSTNSSQGAGFACSFGDNENYAEIRVWKQ